MDFFKKNKWVILIILAAAILAALISVLVVLLNQRPAPPPPSGGGVIFDPNAGDYKNPDDTTPQRPNVAIPGWATLTMPPNTREITVDFFNPDQNAGYYYMTFELRLIDPTKPEGYEVLYTSGYVEAGKHIQRITLSRGLEEGTYAAYIHVQPYRLEDNTPTNNANTAITLIVK